MTISTDTFPRLVSSKLRKTQLHTQKPLTLLRVLSSSFAFLFTPVGVGVNMSFNDIRLPPKWIELNICKRECNAFISTSENSDMCQCGKRKFEHEESVKVIRHSEVAWNPALHSKTVPTDAYGTVIFEGDHHSTKAQFVRIAYDTNPDMVIQLLTLVWGLEMPKLVISVRGGHSDFDLSSRLGKILQNGLIKAARSTGAWIVTGGLNEGVSKHVGTALSHERAVLGLRRNRLVTIGVAPWGIVANREDLKVKNKTVSYSALERSSSSAFRVLNPRHTNFLLVDNGSTGKEGGDQYFRRRLRKTIASYPTSLLIERGCHVPVVCLIIEGGFATLRNIGDFLHDEPPTPVIIFGGSGRTADLVAWTVRKMQSEGNLDEFKPEIFSYMTRIYHVNEAQCHILYAEMKRIVAKRSLLTIYNCHTNNDEDFDAIILASLFRSQHWSPLQQLSLSMLWDRVDIAKNEVFVYGREFSKEHLEHAMMQALIFDRLEFVSLLLEHGLNMQTFLTPTRLEILYSVERKESEIIRMIISDLSNKKKKVKKGENVQTESQLDSKLTLHDIGVAMSHMMGHIYKSRYLHMVSHNTESEGGHSDAHESRCLHPFDDLFVWAVLTSRHGMAVLLWRHGQGAMAKSLVAVKLNKYIADTLENSEKTGDGMVSDFLDFATEWESLSYELLDVAFKQDQKRARQLLTMELNQWSSMTCLKLAVTADHKMLLGHVCCQMLLRDLWMGALNVKNNGTFKILLAIFFPPLIFTLDYKSTEELKLLPQKDKPQPGSVADTDDLRVYDGVAVGEISETLSLRTYGSKSRNSLKSFFNVKDTSLVLHPHHHHPPPDSPPKKNAPNVHHMKHKLVNEFQLTTVDSMPVHQPASVAHPGTNRSSKDAASGPTKHRVSVEIPEHMSHSSEMSLRNTKSVVYNHRRRQDRSSYVTTRQTLGPWNKLVEFQKAPVTNFYRHAISYFIFVCTLSYVILVPQDPRLPGYVEIYVIAFLIAQGCDVIREFFAIDALNWIQKWTEFKGHVWQITDLLFVMFFMSGVGLRFLGPRWAFEYGMLIYRVSSIYWNLRIYKYMGVHRFVGPKIVMMSKMLRHMVYFAMIIFVVIFAFGLSREAIRFPNTLPTWRNMAEAFLEPYVMMFGEVDTDALAPQCGEDDQPDCPVGFWIIPITWAVYMLVANILIVNVLIAVFNGIYSEIDSVAVQVWMFQRFNFVMEFEQKPLLGPPLILFSHAYQIIRWICRRINACICEQELEEEYDEEEGPKIIMGNDHRLKTFLSPAETSIVFDFEEDSQEIFTSSRISRVLLGGSDSTSDALVAQLSEGLGKTSSDGPGGAKDRHSFQQIRLTLREIFTELETHRTKLDKLIENWDEREMTEVFPEENTSREELRSDEDD